MYISKNMLIQEISLIVGLGITAIAAIFTIYDRFTKPDIRAANKIGLLEQGCVLKHEGIDKEIKTVKENYADIKEDIKLIKENHLRHIENDIGTLKSDMKVTLAILQEKYQIKIDK